MIHDILAFLPLTVLIILALVTKNMAGSMSAAVFLAMLFLHKGNILAGTIDAFYETASDSSFQFCLILLVIFGGVIELFQQSGALQGFGNLISKFAKGQKRLLALAWFMSVIMFVDEYLNSITVTFSMRDIMDRNRIPREHLAFQAHAMACCLCVTIPFTGWIGFSLSLVRDYGMGFTEYVKAIPFMFYPIILILISLLLAVGLFPKLGYMKTAYERVEAGGPTLYDEGGENLVGIGAIDDVEPSSALNALIPIIVLISGVLICDNNMISGLILALAAQFLLYIPQRVMKVSDFFEHFLNGAKGMTSIGVIIFLGFTLSTANEKLGFFDIVIGGVGNTLPAFLIPVASFILVAFCVFAVGSCWVVMLITMPVFVPMAMAAGVSVSLTVAAVMSGVCLGYSLCFYADAVFMCTAGTKVSNITIVRTTIPYAIIGGVISAAGFIICGLI